MPYAELHCHTNFSFLDGASIADELVERAVALGLSSLGRHALLLVDGALQREADVVNVVARDVRPVPDVATAAGGPARPAGVRQLGYAGMHRIG